jgi:DNA (cytosine-5)-methyltransferase 1
VSTICGGGAVGFVEAGFILPPEGVHRGNLPRSLEDPLQTITQRGGGHLVQFLIPHFGEREGQAPRTHDLAEPLPAVTGHGAGALVEAEPFLVRYHGNGGAHSVEDPMPALTTRDRVGLVQPVRMLVVNGMALDLRFRMLQPHELAGAMGFPAGYKFQGTRRDVVRQIGNAVEVNMARALCTSLLTDRPPPMLDALADSEEVPA